MEPLANFFLFFFPFFFSRAIVECLREMLPMLGLIEHLSGSGFDRNAPRIHLVKDVMSHASFSMPALSSDFGNLILAFPAH